MNLIDFHVHSDSSDGLLSMRDLAKKAEDVGLDALVLTDHDYWSGSFDRNLTLMDCFSKEIGIPVIVGCEINTPSGEFLLFGKEAIDRWLSFRDQLSKIFTVAGCSNFWNAFRFDVLGSFLKDGIEKMGTPYAMIMCHPASADFYSKQPRSMFELIHGFEIVNRGIRSNPDTVRVLRKLMPWARKLSNSDAHDDEIGLSRNEVDIEGPVTEESLIEWLRRGKS